MELMEKAKGMDEAAGGYGNGYGSPKVVVEGVAELGVEKW